MSRKVFDKKVDALLKASRIESSFFIIMPAKSAHKKMASTGGESIRPANPNVPADCKKAKALPAVTFPIQDIQVASTLPLVTPPAVKPIAERTAGVRIGPTAQVLATSKEDFPREMGIFLSKYCER